MSLNVTDLSSAAGGVSAMAKAGLVSINPLDNYTVPHQAAAGAAAVNSARDFTVGSNLGLRGLEAQVKTFYDLHNKAELNERMIERFILGTSCKTAGLSENCLLLFLSPPKRMFDFI